MSVREEIVYLEPRGAFHLGERGIGLEETAEIVHADTLYAALAAAAVLLDGPAAARDWFGEEPPVLLSSAFPFAGPVRFYPRPMGPPPEGTELPWKDVAFLSEGLLARYLRGEPLPAAVILGEGQALLPEEAEAMRAALGVRELEGMRLWAAEAVPRVALDLPTQRSNLWYFGRVTFRAGAGYFFRVRYRRPEAADAFRAAVRLLGDTGLGGDRTSGHGLFRPRFEPAPPLGGTTGRFLTLAPVYPPRDQVATLLGPGSRYRWLTRSGWIGGTLPAPYRRRTVRMLAEGSLLEGDPAGLWGAWADVTPAGLPKPLPHPVYRYGFAFPVGGPP